jgi:hypothetical protein
MAKRQHVGIIYFMDGSMVEVRPKFLTQKNFTLEELQMAVSGYIEHFPATLKSKGQLYCNENGIAEGLWRNAAVYHVQISDRSQKLLGAVTCVGNAIETFLIEGGPGERVTVKEAVDAFSAKYKEVSDVVSR